MDQIGIIVRDIVLAGAATLKDASAPGLVVLALLFSCAVAIAFLWRDMHGRAALLRRLARKVGEI